MDNAAVYFDGTWLQEERSKIEAAMNECRSNGLKDASLGDDATWIVVRHNVDGGEELYFASRAQDSALFSARSVSALAEQIREYRGP